jgi:ferritin
MGPRFEAVPFYLSMVAFIHIHLLTGATSFLGVAAKTSLEEFDRRLKSLRPEVSVPNWW